MIWDGKDELKVAGEVFEVRLVADADFSTPEALERDWVLEGNARAHVAKGRLVVDSFGSDIAATLWYKGEQAPLDPTVPRGAHDQHWVREPEPVGQEWPGHFEADLVVEYAGVTVLPHGACNFNLFLHATELDGSDVLSRRRSGAYSEYHEINNYIFTLTQGWSRFRRDPGFNCISENLGVRGEPDTHYRIVIVQQGSRFRAFVNDSPVHDVTDPEPHTRGRIALRTWNTSLAYDTFRVWSLV